MGIQHLVDTPFVMIPDCESRMRVGRRLPVKSKSAARTAEQRKMVVAAAERAFQLCGDCRLIGVELCKALGGKARAVLWIRAQASEPNVPSCCRHTVGIPAL